MSVHTVEAAARQIREAGIPRVRVGGGEPTLHPEFGKIIRPLRESTKWLSIFTNAQWRKSETAEILVDNLDMIEVSIDAGGQDHYENTRVGGKFETLRRNVERLWCLRNSRRSSAIINIRLMLRPSTMEILQSEKQLWEQHADTVMIQHLIQDSRTPHIPDLFRSIHSEAKSYPRCSLPFKMMLIRANGEIPLCEPAAKNVVLGSVHTDRLIDMWQGPVMQQYRDAHRKQNTEKMPACRGCVGT